MSQEIDRCWRCGGEGQIRTTGEGEYVSHQVKCQTCHSVGYPCWSTELAIKVWNDGQAKYRQTLSDTALLNHPAGPGAQDKLREDEP